MSNALSRFTFKTKILLLVLASCCALGAPTGAIALKELVQSDARFSEMYR